jgi:TRAP-type C4-dicarboxylate transport system permease small subunit
MNSWFKWVGEILLAFIILIMGYEVIARYIFNEPTKFAVLSATLAQVVLAALGAGCLLKEEGHINIPIITEKLPAHIQHWFRCLSSMIGFIVSSYITYLIWEASITSLKRMENLETLSIPVYPFKFLLALGFALLSLQYLVRCHKYYFLIKR